MAWASIKKPLAVFAAAGCLFLFSCYQGHGLDPLDAGGQRSGITGTITFSGAWPDSTREVRLAILDAYPAGMQDPDSIMAFVLNHLQATSDTLPRFVNRYEFEMPLNPGLYAWVVVAWFPDIPDYFFGVKELGAYYVSDETAIPTPVNVIPGALTPNIDIEADLSLVQRSAPFFKGRRGQ